MVQKRHPVSFSFPRSLEVRLGEEAERQHTTKSAVVVKALQEYFDRMSLVSSWDPISSEDSWYSPNEFYLATQDKHGHSVHLNVYIPKPLAGQLGELANKDMLPYRTTHDVVRDALVHRVHEISQRVRDGEILGGLKASVIAQRLKQKQAEREEALETIQTLQAFLADAFDHGDYELVREEIDRHYMLVDDFLYTHQADLLKVLDGFKEKLKVAGKKKFRVVEELGN